RNLRAFGTVKDWGSDLNLSGSDYQPGNLAALEEGNLTALEGEPAASQRPDAPAPSSAPPPSERACNGKGKIVLILVLLALLGGATGAYLTGQLPPAVMKVLPQLK